MIAKDNQSTEDRREKALWHTAGKEKRLKEHDTVNEKGRQTFSGA